MDIAGDAHAVFWLLILDGVAPGDGAAGLDGLIMSAQEDFMDRFQGQAVGHAQQVHGHRGTSAHGVHIAQRVGGGDLAEQVGIVYDRGKKVHGMDCRDLIGDFINAGVVAGIIANH